MGRWSLAAALAAAVAAASWIGGENGGPVELSRPGGEAGASTVRLALAPSTAKLADPSYGATLPQRAMTREPVDIFANRSWEPPPVERAPEAPPLPFIYVGRMVENGEVTVLLETQDRMHALKAGQSVDDQYRIEEVDGDTVSLIFLPLGVRQTLQLRVLGETAHTADASTTGRRARRARLEAMPATPR